MSTGYVKRPLCITATMRQQAMLEAKLERFERRNDDSKRKAYAKRQRRAYHRNGRSQ